MATPTRTALVILLLALAAPVAAQPVSADPPPTAPLPAPPGPTSPPTAEPTASEPVAAEPTAPEPPPAEPAAPEPEPTPTAAEPKTAWYEKFAIRGYMQMRFNRLYATDEAFANDLGDRAIAADNSFSIRRARLVVSGDAAWFMAIYLQADFAGADAKMRDWYADIFLDRAKTFRLRAGQSKVPYGWENLQSSQNRAPLDRSDPINSGAPGERDLGVFAYWAPRAARQLFKHLVDSGLKGSGDYGVVGLGIYNGQTLNVDDKNENRHVIARVSYPFAIGEQFFELGAGGYVGKFNVATSTGSAGDIRDMRAFATVVVYPQPIGLQAEYTVGQGPELGEDGVIDAQTLHGGHAMLIGHVGSFFPFVRGAYYDGGLKTATNAPHLVVKELAFGTEWQLQKHLELVAEIDVASRAIDGVEVTGAIVRLQAQINY